MPTTKSAGSSAPRDGGKTWQKVLYKDAKTGGIDITFDPAQCQHYVRGAVAGEAHALEPGQRRPGQRAVRSTDGGTTWKQLTGHGLPEGIIGRIGVTVSARIPIASGR